jgi:hypothetical protein
MKAKKPSGIYPLGAVGISWSFSKTRFQATGEFREPLKGEYYLSGAIIEAWPAPNDLSTKY